MNLELILAIFYGAIVGNFATTAYYRIPKNIPINGQRDVGVKPHCSVCDHNLKFYEYLPILSWIFCRHGCNYCGASIDRTYTMLEVAGIFIALILLAFFPIDFAYAILTFALMNVILGVVLLIKYRKLYWKNTLLISSLLIIWRLVL
jgi:leader peptidase (prepilin peptidase)/N-methyltransferase